MKRSLIACALAALCMSAHAVEVKPAAAAFSCPFAGPVTRQVAYEVRMTVYNELVRTFEAALGPLAKNIGDPNVAAKAAATRVDTARMAALAEASGCAALLDERSSCANFFDTELGDPLSVFTSMKKTAPLRKQYEEALAHLSRPDFKRAAQFCMKLVGRA
jgi:hypothetical protein